MISDRMSTRIRKIGEKKEEGRKKEKRNILFDRMSTHIGKTEKKKKKGTSNEHLHCISFYVVFGVVVAVLLRLLCLLI